MRLMLVSFMAGGVLAAAPAAQALVPSAGQEVPRGTPIESPACERWESGYPNIPPQPEDIFEVQVAAADLSSDDGGWIGSITAPDCEPITATAPGNYRLTVSTAHRVEQFLMGTWLPAGSEVDSYVISFTVGDDDVCLAFASVRDAAGRDLTDAQLNAIGIPGRQLKQGGAITLPAASMFPKGIEMRTRGGTVLRLANGSRMKVGKKCEGPDGDDGGWPMKIRLVFGAIWAKIGSRDAAGDFEVRTERVVAGPRGTTFEVRYERPRKRTRIRVFDGEVHMAPGGAPHKGVVLRAGQTGVHRGSGPVRRVPTAPKR
jgi:hypothetical protein